MNKKIHRITDHPCFNADVKGKYGRIHLAVAPRCNIRCNYCNRLHDCPNESRPGVTSRVYTPAAALAHLGRVMKNMPHISVVGIAGPGDPLANPEDTFGTLALVRERYPQLLLCLSTNGLLAVDHLDDIISSGINHLSLTVNAVDSELGAKIYKWVRLDGRTYRGVEAAEVLLERQLDAIRRLKQAGLTVKINTVVIPGINDFHVLDVVKKMRGLSVDLLNLMPLYPVEGTAFQHVPEPSHCEIMALRRKARAYIPQMSHCSRCRADAVGLIGKDDPKDLNESLLGKLACN